MEIANLIFYQLNEAANNFIFLHEKRFWVIGLVIFLMIYLGIKSEKGGRI